MQTREISSAEHRKRRLKTIGIFRLQFGFLMMTLICVVVSFVRAEEEKQMHAELSELLDDLLFGEEKKPAKQTTPKGAVVPASFTEI